MSGFHHPREQSLATVHRPHLPLRMDLPCGLANLLLSGMWCHRDSSEEQRFVLVQFFLQMQGLLPTSDCLPPSKVPRQHIQRGTCVQCMCHLRVLSLSVSHGGFTASQIPCSKRNSWIKLLPLLPLMWLISSMPFCWGGTKSKPQYHPWNQPVD